MTPEWSRPERIDTIGERDRTISITADAQERAALARRFGLVAIDRLAAELTVRRAVAAILVNGRVTGEIVQACAVTDDPIPAVVDETIALRFVAPSDQAEEIELSEDALDTVEFEGAAIDLGEAAAETLALALDPFPRSARAADVLREAGVITEGEAGPFGALAGLKAKLQGR